MNSNNSKKIQNLIIESGVIKHWFIKEPRNKRVLLDKFKSLTDIRPELQYLLDKTVNGSTIEIKNLVCFMFLVYINIPISNKRIDYIYACVLDNMPDLTNDTAWKIFCNNAFPNLINEGLQLLETEYYE